MRRSIWLGAVALAAAGAISAGCEEESPTTPTATNPTAVTERFSGALSVSGAVAFPFNTTATGLVSLTVNAVAPDTTTVVGASIGTWNAASSSCSVSVGLFNDNATQGTAITGQISTVGTLCARIYDVGRLTAPITFEITVIHP
jgi:hypothetical protein